MAYHCNSIHPLISTLRIQETENSLLVFVWVLAQLDYQTTRSENNREKGWKRVLLKCVGFLVLHGPNFFYHSSHSQFMIEIFKTNRIYFAYYKKMDKKIVPGVFSGHNLTTLDRKPVQRGLKLVPGDRLHFETNKISVQPQHKVSLPPVFDVLAAF